jgi:hypothetical protein
MGQMTLEARWMFAGFRLAGKSMQRLMAPLCPGFHPAREQSPAFKFPASPDGAI